MFVNWRETVDGVTRVGDGGIYEITILNTHADDMLQNCSYDNFNENWGKEETETLYIINVRFIIIIVVIIVLGVQILKTNVACFRF